MWVKVHLKACLYKILTKDFLMTLWRPGSIVTCLVNASIIRFCYDWNCIETKGGISEFGQVKMRR